MAVLSHLKGFLHLSKASPVPALHFLLGEMPIEGKLHMGIMTVFHNIWANPDTTMFKILQYLLAMSGRNSSTWSAHVRLLCLKYDLPDPLDLLRDSAWPKKRWTELVRTKITTCYEKALRLQASRNIKM